MIDSAGKSFVILNKIFFMTTLEIKNGLHKLIDNIEDEAQLKKAYRLIESLSTINEEGALWSKLSNEEQQELLEIEKKSHLPDNLIDHKEMLKKHQKWL